MSKKNERKTNTGIVYSFGDFWKKHTKLLAVLCIIPVVACAVFIPLLCVCKINIWDLGSFLGGLLAYIGTALLGAVSMWQNERQKKENDKALAEERARAEEDKLNLLEQNRRMAYDNARLSVIPVLSIRQIFYRNKKNLLDFPEPQKNQDDEYGYIESNSKYYAITLGINEITVQTKETKEIKDYKENPFKLKTDKNHVRTYSPRTDSYLPFEIINIGKGNANKFSFAIYKEGCTDEKLRKYISARPFNLMDALRMDIYVPDINAEAVYWLEFTYEDILGNKYEQKDYIKIKQEDSEFSINFPQTLKEQNNG